MRSSGAVELAAEGCCIAFGFLKHSAVGYRHQRDPTALCRSAPPHPSRSRGM